jgi:hypothetical protein
MQRPYWPLLALCASPDHRLTPVQIQKALFLLRENLPNKIGKHFYNFIPYHFGPFDAEVYRDLDGLEVRGWVRKVRADNHRGSDYELTPGGISAALSMKPGNEVAASYLRIVAEWMKPLSFSALVSSIYNRYPRYRSQSVFRE